MVFTKRRRALRLTLALGILVLLATPVATACFTTGGQSKSSYGEIGSKKLLLYLESQSATSGPFLSPDKEAGKSTVYAPSETGVASVPDSYRHLVGQRVPYLEFKLPELAQSYYLNLSRYIYVELHWTTLAGPTIKPGTIRVELWTRDDSGKDVFVMGDSKGSNPALGLNPPMWMIQRPEVSMLEKGQPLVLRVMRMSGYVDWGVGTGGTQQSFIEIGYYDSDPLANPLYLNSYERGKFAPPTPGEGEGTPEQGAPLWPLLGLGILLVAWPGRRQPSARLVALLLLVGPLAGCMGSAAPAQQTGEAPPSGTADIQVTDDPELEQQGTARLEGTILDNSTGLPVIGAHLVILGTNLFMDTNKTGRFQFLNLTPAAYHLRVDAKDFQPYETQVQLRAGQIVNLQIRLDPPSARASFDRAHIHDNWGDATEMLLYEGSLFNGPLPGNLLVLPGTTRMQIQLTWTPGPNGPFEQEIKLSTAIGVNLCFSHRAPGVPYNFHFFPNEADSGHARLSQWSFDFGALERGNVVIRIYKGVVPFEPTHKDFWGQNVTRPMLLDSPPRNPTAASTPQDHPNTVTVWDRNFFVPPGTAEIRGHLKWTNAHLGTTPVPQTQWKLLYKPANLPWGPQQDPGLTPGLKAAAMTANGTNNYNFVIKVLPEEVDQFYQTRTQWAFMLDDGYDGVPKGVSAVRPMSPNTNYGTQWLLTAEAHRDSAWVPS